MIHYTENIFSNQETSDAFLKRVDELVAKEKLQQAAVYNDGSTGSVDTKMRRSKVCWLTDKQIRYEVCDYVMQMNAGTLGFDLYPFSAEVQYAEYSAEDQGHFDWHMDQNPFMYVADNNHKFRKYSATLQLGTMGEDYEGGKFEVQNFEIEEKYYKRGCFILFPSPMVHRVSPVTKGLRRALVFFFHGPKFR